MSRSCQSFCQCLLKRSSLHRSTLKDVRSFCRSTSQFAVAVTSENGLVMLRIFPKDQRKRSKRSARTEEIQREPGQPSNRRPGGHRWPDLPCHDPWRPSHYSHEFLDLPAPAGGLFGVPEMPEVKVEDDKAAMIIQTISMTLMHYVTM
jgi:hypothetical protein